MSQRSGNEDVPTTIDVFTAIPGMLRQDPHQQKEVLIAGAKRQGKTWPSQRHLFPRATSNFIKKLTATDKTLPAPPHLGYHQFLYHHCNTYKNEQQIYECISLWAMTWKMQGNKIRSSALKKKMEDKATSIYWHSNNSQEIYVYFFIWSLQESYKLGNIVPNSQERKLSLKMFMGLRTQNFKSGQAVHLGQSWLQNYRSFYQITPCSSLQSLSLYQTLHKKHG